MQHARDRVRELTARDRLLLPVEEIVEDLNRFLRGWAGYFRYGNSTRPFDTIIRTRNGWRYSCGNAPQRAIAVRPEAVAANPRPLRTDQPQRNHRRAPAQPAVAPGTPNAGGEERR